MLHNISTRVTPDVAGSEERLKKHVAALLKIDARTITTLRTRRRSIDARQRTIYINLTLDVYINETPHAPEFELVAYA